MAPRSRKRPSDDFVVPDNEDEVAPRAKRVKSEEGGKSTKVDKSASAKLASDSKKINASDDAIVIGGGKISKEGEEYWEVCSCLPHTNRTFGKEAARTVLTDFYVGIAIDNKTSCNLHLRRKAHGEHSRVLREGWRAVTGEEGSSPCFLSWSYIPINLLSAIC